MISGRRKVAARILVLAASLALLVAVVAGYLRYVAIDSDQFADRAVVALHDRSVRGLIADEITAQVLGDNSVVASAARPVVASVTSAVITSSGFTALFRAAVRASHAALLDGSSTNLTLSIGNLGSLVAAQLRGLGPVVSGLQALTRRVTIISRRIGSLDRRLIDASGVIKLSAPIAAVLFVIFAIGALAVSRRRAQTLVTLGVGIAVVGLVIAVGLIVRRSIMVDNVNGAQQQAAAKAVWDAYLGTGATAGWILAALGGALAAATFSRMRWAAVRSLR